MSERNIKILSGPDAATRIDGQDEVLRRLTGELPQTKLIIRRLLDDDPTDDGAEARVLDIRTAELRPKFDEGKASIATVDGKIGAMVHYEHIGEWQGRPVYEIRAGVVLPEFRGEGISSQLFDACRKRVFALQSNALCLSQTGNKGLLARYAKWQGEGISTPMTPVDFENMKRQAQGEKRLREDEEAEVTGWYEGCGIYLVDLQKLSDAGGLKDE